MAKLLNVFLAAVLVAAANPTSAQQYPDKPIRLLVPFAPGGVVDTSARILTNKLTERLGWQFVVDNRPGGNGFVVVGSQQPIQSWKDLIAMAKAKPGQVSYGSPGNGSVNHLATEWLASAAGIKLNHVPYKGGAPAVAAVAGGEVVMTVAGLPGVTPFLKPPRVRVISISTAKRTPQTAEWTSAGEAGLGGGDALIWVGLFSPKSV